MTAATKRGLERTIENRDRWLALLDMLQQAPPEYKDPIMEGYVELLLENDEELLRRIETGEPLISAWGNGVEIWAAMDIHYFCEADQIFYHMPFKGIYDLEKADKMTLPDDVCSLVRISSYAVKEGLVPDPTAVLAMTTPCDALFMVHQQFINNEWKNIPTFALDPTYGESEREMEYFVGELKRMIAFMEETHPGYKLDYNKLREVITESNKQYELWAEYNQLLRAVPCPGTSFQIALIAWTIVQHLKAGNPKATKLLEMMVAKAEQMVKEGKGALENERIRIVWPDLKPVWMQQIVDWLAQEWGAVVVMDFEGFDPYTTIDTSTEETMLQGLSKRILCDVPMVRQSRSTVSTFIDDLRRCVTDYKADCVIWPGHMGHKDQAASHHFVEEACRELNVPLLYLTTSLYDERYMPLDKIKKQISEFFSVTGLGSK